MDTQKYLTVSQIKAFRVAVSTLLLEIQTGATSDVGPADATGGINNDLYSLATDAVEAKLIEAKMWAGKIIEALGAPFPAQLADNAVAPATDTAADVAGDESSGTATTGTGQSTQADAPAA